MCCGRGTGSDLLMICDLKLALQPATLFAINEWGEGFIAKHKCSTELKKFREACDCHMLCRSRKEANHFVDTFIKLVVRFLFFELFYVAFAIKIILL